MAISKTTTTRKKTKPQAASKPVAPVTTPSLPELLAQVKAAIAALQKIESGLPTLTSLTPAERQTSPGRMHDGEVPILRVMLGVVAKNVAFFQSLADEDEGHDPNTLETALLGERLDTIDALGPLLIALTDLTREVSDTIMATGALVKPVLLAAYAMAKPNKKLRPKIAKVVEFYGGPAKKAARTRKKKKKSGK